MEDHMDSRDHAHADGGGRVEVFTPGDWKWDAGLVPPDGFDRYADIYTDGGDTIIANFNDLIPEGRANARLICAAKVLLETLQRNRAALDLIDPMRPLQFATTMDLMRKDMDAALAKALPPPTAGTTEAAGEQG